ncbi:hypothetical protein F5Y15DRAFT_280806 [Xylariaceae sp. FL0016]|nr:hypothetical protein F5Y15DRAFT_280806 [Xylariaceae sp. FL0016]
MFQWPGWQGVVPLEELHAFYVTTYYASIRERVPPRLAAFLGAVHCCFRRLAKHACRVHTYIIHTPSCVAIFNLAAPINAQLPPRLLWIWEIDYRVVQRLNGGGAIRTIAARYLSAREPQTSRPVCRVVGEGVPVPQCSFARSRYVMMVTMYSALMPWVMLPSLAAPRRADVDAMADRRPGRTDSQLGYAILHIQWILYLITTQFQLQSQDR